MDRGFHTNTWATPAEHAAAARAPAVTQSDSPFFTFAPRKLLWHVSHLRRRAVHGLVLMVDLLLGHVAGRRRMVVLVWLWMHLRLLLVLLGGIGSLGMRIGGHYGSNERKVDYEKRLGDRE